MKTFQNEGPVDLEAIDHSANVMVQPTTVEGFGTTLAKARLMVKMELETDDIADDQINVRIHRQDQLSNRTCVVASVIEGGVETSM